MATKAPKKQTSPANSGWAANVLKTITAIFVVAIVFGVFLFAMVVSNNTLVGLQPYGSNTAFTASAGYTNNAFNSIASNSIYITLTGAANTIISPTFPLSVTLGGNSISTYATNVITIVPGIYEYQTFTVSNVVANAVLTSTSGNFYNITSIAITPIGIPAANFTTGLVASVTQKFAGVKAGSAPSTFATNSITLSGTYTATAQTISGYTPSTLFLALGSWIVTLANFVGIIILLVIIMIVILVIYALFAPLSGGMSGGQMAGI